MIEGVLRSMDSYADWRGERDAKRGYSMNMKLIVMAFAIELVVIAASLRGAYHFAQTYGHGDDETMIAMMLAPIGYAVIEFCRVPLAMAVRTQRNWLLKFAAFLGLLCAALVTAKSMSQLGYLMFQPRLEAVTTAQRDYKDAVGKRDNAQVALDRANDKLAEATAQREAADHALEQAVANLGAVPKQECHQVWKRNRKGQRYQDTVCTKLDPRLGVFSTSVKDAETKVSEAIAVVDKARAERDAIDVATLDAAVTKTETAKKDAIFHSQLHTFTAMAFGKDPDQVTEGELHWFMRLFVFVPAVCMAFASTLIALVAIQKIKRKPDVMLPEEAGRYLLGPLMEAVVGEANRVVNVKAEEVMGEVRARAASAAEAAPQPDLDPAAWWTDEPAPTEPPAKSRSSFRPANDEAEKIIPLKAAE